MPPPPLHGAFSPRATKHTSQIQGGFVVKGPPLLTAARAQVAEFWKDFTNQTSLLSQVIKPPSRRRESEGDSNNLPAGVHPVSVQRV